MSLQRALEFLAAQEGGWVNDPNDAGGETFRGISRKAHPNWSGWALVDSGLRGTSDADIAVADFYEAEYWQPAHCYELPEPIDLAVFDLAVHSGVTRAVRYLQSAIGAVSDGHFGPATREAVRAILERKASQRVAMTVVNLRRAFMVRGFRRGSFSKAEPLRFLSGFWKRLTDLSFEIGRGTT